MSKTWVCRLHHKAANTQDSLKPKLPRRYRSALRGTLQRAVGSRTPPFAGATMRRSVSSGATRGRDFPEVASTSGAHSKGAPPPRQATHGAPPPAGRPEAGCETLSPDYSC